MHNVLIVDDNDVMRESIEHLLIKEGYYVSTACDGEEACAQIDHKNFDIVVTDMQMPVADGSTVLKHIKRNPDNDHVGVIVISSIGREKAILDALDLGADEYYTKPLMPVQLVLRIKRLLAQKVIKRMNKMGGNTNLSTV